MDKHVCSINNLEILIRENLQNPSKVFWKSISIRAKNNLRKFQQKLDSESSNKSWFLLAVANLYIEYITCYELMQKQKYYDAWCGLERAEILVPWLIRNPFYEPASFNAEKMLARVREWQSLFPYKLFFSPGLLEKKKECSICHQIIVPWTDCGHQKGYVYDGIQCFHIVKEVELLELSIVLQPVQKYSVLIYQSDENGNKVDYHDYSIVSFLCERIKSPFDNWRYFRTMAFHPHDLFSLINKKDACPCESGREYEYCCLPLPGVKRPHIQFEFEKSPPSELPTALISGYGSRNGPVVINEHTLDDLPQS